MCMAWAYSVVHTYINILNYDAGNNDNIHLITSQA